PRGCACTDLLSEDPSLDDFLYDVSDHQAMGHVLRVASSIDSMVVGEPQILGQLKDAYRAAVECGACGPVLSRLFQHAFSTAKRVRNETRIAERPVSVARVAVDLTRQIFEDLRDKRALLIGAGDMIEAALDALQRDGLGSVLVANRTRSRAEALAEQFGATPHALDEVGELLTGVDVVLSCIGGDQPLLSADQVRGALRARRSRPLFLIDLGVPRNIDPAVNELDNAFLYDIDDLQDVAAANVEERRRETLRAEDIVREEEQRFDGWLVALQAVPTIQHLRSRAEAIRSAELERALRRLELDETQREGLEKLTHSIVNKLLHAPLSRLRADTDREEGLAMLEAARALFALDDPDAPGADADADGELVAEAAPGDAGRDDHGE
ncbi:MAG: glutamyl-tRNA reductase, partial [Proteobacteria bacterium]|nr:glutamyl-tRNA reductase [Pseudomonadota bacterium]